MLLAPPRTTDRFFGPVRVAVLAVRPLSVGANVGWVSQRDLEAAMAEATGSEPVNRITRSCCWPRNVGTPVLPKIFVVGLAVPGWVSLVETDSMSVGVWKASRVPSYDQTRWVGDFTPEVNCTGLGLSWSAAAISIWPLALT